MAPATSKLPIGEGLNFERTPIAMLDLISKGGPLVWLLLEPFADATRMELIAEQWPSGARRHLASTSPHGTEVDWDPKPCPDSLR